VSVPTFVTFEHDGRRYVRCGTCRMVGREGWAHAHARDVDGEIYGTNWYRSVEELERRLAEEDRTLTGRWQ